MTEQQTEPTGTTRFHCPVMACDWFIDQTDTSTVLGLSQLQHDIASHAGEAHTRHDLSRALGTLQMMVEMLPDERLAAAELRFAREREANDRCWELVKQWRQEAVDRGWSQYDCPYAQALAGALVGDPSTVPSSVDQFFRAQKDVEDLQKRDATSWTIVNAVWQRFRAMVRE
ncbi:hypothetical protein [Streptomyces lavendofoliae]|uniref:Uncharacterized protein n=1 Tax=Streptomyces lavendofoliae TaxID=67314 RepID=A0A918I3C0_9ACTN|nr:hypothetical protein [Streptomyces lavendofoliae]GGU62353.1 hypothetical protein GCM10010274_58910 [Streptomyces lavendofoliae]